MMRGLSAAVRAGSLVMPSVSAALAGAGGTADGCWTRGSDFMIGYSVDTTSPRASAAARSAYHASVAHLTRTGNWRTPASTESLPRSSTGASGDAVTVRWKRSNSASASATVFPFTLSVMSDADAFEMAQPDP